MKRFLLILTMLIMIVVYGYHSGSCKRSLKYPCSETFCLIRKFVVDLPPVVLSELEQVIPNESLYKRVNIDSFPERIGPCAIPNKRGITISTFHLIKQAPQLISFYQTQLRDIVSNQLQLNIYPTSLTFPTTCAILIYNQEGDWINWHYDYNYYQGRFFTVLIPLTKQKTCTQFQYQYNDQIYSLDLTDFAIVFEGNYLYHRASKLCNGENRILLACQYVTNNQMTWWNQFRIKAKDIAYTGF